MSTSEKGKVQFEGGQTLVSYTAMTSTDNLVFTVSGGTLFSGKSGFEAVVRPNGIVTGRNLLSPGSSSNEVDVAGFTAYSKGVAQSVAAETLTLTRGTSGSPYIINSIFMDSVGDLSVVSGTGGSAFSETRGAAGGAPTIPADSVEVGQVRMTSSTAAVITSAEIFQVVGTHTMRFDYPTWEVNTVGDGDSAISSNKKNAYVEFSAAKETGVYISYNAPVFVEASKALNFTPIENSHSVSSTQYYNGTIASVASTLGQGGFTALLNDGVTDTLVGNKDEILTIKFYPDRNKTPFILSQGKIGLGRTYPVSGQNQATVTVSGERKSVEFSS